MSIFCYKPIRLPARIGEVFRRHREELGWDITQIARSGHIPEKYIRALESGNFTELPHTRAHRLAYVKHYALVLGLDSNKCTEQFYYENGLTGTAPATHVSPVHKTTNGRSISMIVRNTIIAASMILFVGYLAWQVKGIIEPPHLVIVSPLDGAVVSERSILVQGEAESGTRLTINGQEVAGDSRGQFRIPVDVVDGLNTLTIAATKKHGKATEYVINVIRKPSIFNTK